MAPARPVSTGLVQEVTIADETGSTILSAWDTNIDKIQMSITYNFQRLFVCSYKNEKALTLSTQSTYEISTNAGIKLQSVGDGDNIQKIKDAVIISKHNFTLHYSCVNCDNRLTDVSGMLSQCSEPSTATCPSRIELNFG